MMEITFTKGNNKKHIISCTRKDATQTWMHCDDFFIAHDLAHYAAETSLGYKSSFYGMLAGGVSITDFELPKAQRNFLLTQEAIVMEHLVNLLTIEMQQGTLSDLNKVFAESFTNNDSVIEPPVFSTGQLEAIRNLYTSLMKQWYALGEEEKMVLHFEE